MVSGDKRQPVDPRGRVRPRAVRFRRDGERQGQIGQYPVRLPARRPERESDRSDELEAVGGNADPLRDLSGNRSRRHFPCAYGIQQCDLGVVRRTRQRADRRVELIKAFNIWDEEAQIEIPIVPNYADIPRIAELVERSILRAFPASSFANTAFAPGAPMHSRRSAIWRHSSFCSNTPIGLLY